MEYNNKFVSPSHVGTITSPQHEHPPPGYEDPIEMLAHPVCDGLTLFAFHSGNAQSGQDCLATARLLPILTRGYFHPAEQDEPHTLIHRKIITLFKEKKELVTSWLDDIFNTLNGNNTPRQLPDGAYSPSSHTNHTPHRHSA